MSAYDMDSILNKWERGTITTEQAVGQILLLIQALSQRVGHLERRLEHRRGSRDAQATDKEAKDEAEGEKDEAERPSAEPPTNS